MSLVIAIDECPRASHTCSSRASATNISTAAVCLKSWKRISGNPLSLMIRLYWRRTLDCQSCAPWAEVKTKSLSSHASPSMSRSSYWRTRQRLSAPRTNAVVMSFRCPCEVLGGLETICVLEVPSGANTWTSPLVRRTERHEKSDSISSHLRPNISPKRNPIVTAIKQIASIRSSFKTVEKTKTSSRVNVRWWFSFASLSSTRGVGTAETGFLSIFPSATASLNALWSTTRICFRVVIAKPSSARALKRRAMSVEVISTSRLRPSAGTT